jgi:hypothetical protein
MGQAATKLWGRWRGRPANTRPIAADTNWASHAPFPTLTLAFAGDRQAFNAAGINSIKCSIYQFHQSSFKVYALERCDLRSKEAA